MDRLPVLENLARQRAPASALFKFVADPPTTSLQRLKGLTTGGLPTFVDIGNSFGGGPSITEDNLILQLAKRGKRVVMMGDDTWTELFPTQFSKSHPFPSFNVKDIHTVDNGVISELYPALGRDDWDVLIAHFLGVDHVGHTFGVDSQPMYDKLDQMDAVVKAVVAVMDGLAGEGGIHRDSLLLVMGDHGQTLSGDHGGGTPEEVDSALFALSMRTPPQPPPPKLRSKPCRGKSGFCISTLPQMDFAATMSMLLGVPIPYGSVGKVNAEMWALAPASWRLGGAPAGGVRESRSQRGQREALSWMAGFGDAVATNSMQVQRYLDAYFDSASRPPPRAEMHVVRSLRSMATALPAPSGGAVEDLERESMKAHQRIEAYMEHLAAAAELARSQWTNFGAVDMGLGLAVLVASLIAHGMALWRMRSAADRGNIFPVALIVFAGLVGSVVGGAVGGLVSRLLALLGASKALTVRWQSASLAGASLASVAVFSLAPSDDAEAAMAEEERRLLLREVEEEALRESMEEAKPKSGRRRGKKGGAGKATDAEEEGEKKGEGEGKITEEDLTESGEGVSKTDLWGWADERVLSVGLFVLMHACSLLSNSFIVAEGHVATFLLATCGVLYLRRAVRSSSGRFWAVSFLVLNAALVRLGLPTASKTASAEVEESVPPWILFLLSSQQQEAVLAFANGPSGALAAAFVEQYLPLLILQHILKKKAKSRGAGTFGCGVVMGKVVPILYAIVALHWGVAQYEEVRPGALPSQGVVTARLEFPKVVYGASGLLAMLVLMMRGRGVLKRKLSGVTYHRVDPYGEVAEALLALASVLSAPLVMLLGRRGPLILLLGIFQGICLVKLQSSGASSVGQTKPSPLPKGSPSVPSKDDTSSTNPAAPPVSSRARRRPNRGGGTSRAQGQSTGESAAAGSQSTTTNGISSTALAERKGGVHAAAAIEWSFLSMQLFFCTGHRCTFDGLHYAAAFTGFEKFNFYRQGVLLALESFGASHIAPTLLLPLLVVFHPSHQRLFLSESPSFIPDVAKVFLAYGLHRALTATVTTAFVTLMRRHLMVWALFAPKYVFDGVSLILTDALIVFCSQFAFSTHFIAWRSHSLL